MAHVIKENKTKSNTSFFSLDFKFQSHSLGAKDIKTQRANSHSLYMITLTLPIVFIVNYDDVYI